MLAAVVYVEDLVFRDIVEFKKSACKIAVGIVKHFKEFLLSFF